MSRTHATKRAWRPVQIGSLGKFAVIPILGLLLMNVGQSGKAFGQSAQTAAAQGVYTTAQAERGRQVYDRQCAVCHGGSLSGIDVNPPLAGSRFLSGWKGQSVGALVTRIRATMPPEKPGSLTVSQSVDVAAFILRTNRFPAGTRDLPVTPAGLRSIKIDQPPSVRR